MFILFLFFLTEFFFDLENDLPDELIPNGDLNLLGTGGGLGQDAASQNKQLSDLLRGGNPGLGAGMGRGGSGSPVQQSMGGQGQQGSPGLGNLGGLNKSPLNQGLSGTPPSGLNKPATGTPGPSVPTSQSQKQVGMVAGSPAAPQASAGICINSNFNQGHQALMNNNSGHALMSQAQPAQGQVLNGSLGPGNRGRGASLQYNTSTLQSTPGSVLAETLTQGTTSMPPHTGMTTAQTGPMTKVCTGLPWLCILGFYSAQLHLQLESPV